MQINNDRRPVPPEEVVPFNDPATGVTGTIVLHSTALGPAAGGCRLWRYGSDGGAAADALRLAEGMTLKNALADLPLGGGKVVLRDPQRPFDRKSLFRALGRTVQALDGRYVTAEDVGTTVGDMEVVAGQTRHVAGLESKAGSPGGDPSPWTARGVFEAMRVAVRHRLDAELGDVTVAIQGLGHVGFALCELLYDAGCKLLVAEPRSDLAARAAVRFEATIHTSASLLHTPAHVFAPCALGGVLDFVSVSNLKAKVVCGAANNQLFSETQAEQLADRDILYAPDFLVNAGGIINVAAEYLGWDQEEVRGRVGQIGARLGEILQVAEDKGLLPNEAAMSVALDRVARRRLAAAS